MRRTIPVSVTRAASCAQGPPPGMPPERVVPVSIKTVQLDGNLKLFQCYTKDHLRYEAEYGLKRGTTTNSYLLLDGDEGMLVDVPRKEYLDVFCAAPLLPRMPSFPPTGATACREPLALLTLLALSKTSTMTTSSGNKTALTGRSDAQATRSSRRRPPSQPSLYHISTPTCSKRSQKSSLWSALPKTSRSSCTSPTPQSL